MQKDLYNNVKSFIALAPIVINSDAVNAFAIIDTKGYNSGKLCLGVGVITLGTLIVTEIQEDDLANMSTETPIPSARLQGTIAALSVSGTFQELGFICTKRYIRITATSASSANLLAFCTVELGNPDQGPVR